MMLFDDQSSNGNSSSTAWYGGVGTFAAYGTWDGATCKLQMSPDGGTTWIDVGDDVTLTANDIGNFQLPACDLRANLAGVGTTSIDAKVLR